MGSNQIPDFMRLYDQTVSAFVMLFKWFPYWGPFVFALIFWEEWVRYVQSQFRANLKWVMLEIKIPKTINKTPLAMEIVLQTLLTKAPGNWYDKYWKGKIKEWSSLEMVSFEGHIKFFIRTTSSLKNLVETQLYGQYPDIEIFEVPDYTLYVDYKPGKAS